MQLFDAEPTDSQLAVLLDAAHPPFSVRTEDSPAELRAVPRGYPLWFIAFCGLIPLGLFAGILADEAARGVMQPVEAIAFAHGCLAVPTMVAFFHWLNRRMIARGDFFVVDKAQRTLTLPRHGLVLRADQIRCFVELQAWRAEQPSAGRPYPTWVGELSVLARSADGRLARFPILTCEQIGRVHRVASALAEFFGVDCRLLKLDAGMRRRLKAEVAGRS